MMRLAVHPEASMQEIAEAAGVHRATVHRHFATRGELLRAVRVRALDEFQAVLVDPVLAELPPGAALERLTRRSLELGDRRRLYRVVPSFDDLTDTRGDTLRAPVRAVLARAQDAGVVRRDVPPTMLAAAWSGLVLIALPLVGGGELDLEAAERFVLRLLSAT
jgi:AcrR family transcriptional regulator